MIFFQFSYYLSRADTFLKLGTEQNMMGGVDAPAGEDSGIVERDLQRVSVLPEDRPKGKSKGTFHRPP